MKPLPSVNDLKKAMTRATSARALACSLGLTRSRLVTVMAHYGLSIPYRGAPNAKLTVIQVKQACRMLKAGKAQIVVAKAFGCSLELIRELSLYDASLRRDARAARGNHLREEHRAHWLSACRRSAMTRTQLRVRHAATYEWLTKHDSVWLSTHLPPRVRPDILSDVRRNWTSRDRLLAQAIQEVHRQLLGRSKPVRITSNLLLRQAGGLSSFTNNQHLQRFSRTKSVLARLTEPVHAFYWRKIQWAMGKLRRDPRPLTAHWLAKHTGISPPRLHQFDARIVAWARARRIPVAAHSVYSR